MEPLLVTIPFLLLILGFSLYVGYKSPSLLLGALLLLLLFHEIALRFLRNLTDLSSSSLFAISTWKEIVLLGILVSVVRLIRETGELKALLAKYRIVLISLAAFLLWGALRVFTSPNLLAGLAAFRDYMEPLLIFIAVLVIQPRANRSRRMFIIWLAAGFIISALAIWQGLAWDRELYLMMGFGDVSGQVGIPPVGIAGEVRIRPPGTVTGPNELAIHLMLMVSFLVLRVRHWMSARRLWVLLLGLPYLLALLLTASRSGVLALFTALGLIAVQFVGAEIVKGRQGQAQWIRILVVGLVLVVFVGLLMVATSIDHWMIATVKNLGDQYHIKDTADALAYLYRNPNGAGMGLAGPRQGLGFPEVAAYHVEGSLFQLAVEMGVFGLVLFIIFLAVALRRVWQNWQTTSNSLTSVIAGTAFVGWLGALIAFLFLPLMQAMTLMVWLWFFLGFSLIEPQLGGQADQGGE